jgi:hypothetical protein
MSAWTVRFLGAALARVSIFIAEAGNARVVEIKARRTHGAAQAFAIASQHIC